MGRAKNRKCDVADCSNKHVARGLCGTHYQESRRLGRFDQKECLQDGCEGASFTSGLCVLHYQRKMNGRSMDAPVQAKHPAMVRDQLGRKLCKECRQWLDEADYGPHSKSTDGLNSRCRFCHSMSTRLKKYGLSSDAFQGILDAQGGRCPICTTESPGGIGWVVDHDHSCCPTGPSGGKTCGKCVRGLLCQNCNAALGMLDDSIEKLERAQAYLLASKNG